jgi:potassium channel subfamily K, other eukaryote
MTSEQKKPFSSLNVGYESIGSEDLESRPLPSNKSDQSLDKEIEQIVETKIEDKLVEEPGKYLYTIVIAFLGYLVISAEVYVWMEGISHTDAIYLSMITFTTIGYGDLVPTHPVSKFFTCGFVFLNLLIVGQLLDYVVEAVVEQRKKASQDFLENVFDKEEIDTDAERHNHWISKEYMALYEALLQAISMIGGTVAVGTIFFAFLVDNHNIVDAIYLSCMTVSTVGYGDIVPTNIYSRIFGCFFAVGGTLTFGSAVSGFIGALGEYRMLAKNEQTLNNSVLDYDTFCKADADGSDSVTKEEFVLFRLTQMGVIPSNLRERAEQQFDRMDADGSGDLTMEDIILHQNSHHTPEHKQRLIDEYRQHKLHKEGLKNLELLKTNTDAQHKQKNGIIDRRGSTGSTGPSQSHHTLPI